jgi:hypothetical protein
MISPIPSNDAFLSLVPGPEVVRQYFRRCRARERLSHAYLLTGPSNSGKLDFSRGLAQALFCPSSTPCGSCPSCLAAEHGNHASIHELVPVKAGAAIDIAQVRKLSQQDRRSRSGFIVWILDDVERMSPSAMNALLKTLEEPNAGALLILLAQSVGTLLPTIVSRCHRVPFPGRIPELANSDLDPQSELLSLPARDDFYARHDPRQWLEEVAPGASNRRQAVGSVLDDLIHRVHQEWLRIETEGVRSGDRDALERLEKLLLLREDLNRNVNADLVLESLIVECKKSVR